MWKFEKIILASITATVCFLVAVWVGNPIQTKTSAPTYTLVEDKYISRKHRVTSEIDTIKKLAAGKNIVVERLLSVNGVKLPEGVGSLKSSKNVNRVFSKIGYSLESIHSGNYNVPRLFLTSMPDDMDAIHESENRKSLFCLLVLPLILQVNEEILKDRTRILRLKDQLDKKVLLNPIDRLWLLVIAEGYKVESDDLELLAKRVDIIPPSLALAQAAEESGWGTSHFVKRGNAIFGEWTNFRGNGIVPRNRDVGKTHKVRSFTSLIASVRAYAKNLNTHRAYDKMRELRAAMRVQGRSLSSLKLSNKLSAYSQRGESYVKTLQSIIKINKLWRLDKAGLKRLKKVRSLI